MNKQAYPRLLLNFNPHSRKGSDCRNDSSVVLTPFYFNPHSRKGSDQRLMSANYRERISIHTPARGVTKFLEEREAGLSISIHTPARGVTETCPQGSRCAGNFNPHSRKGSDCIQSDRHQNHYRISIHTPARGVTIFKIHCMDRIGISIHTPARGVTSLFTA